MKILLIDDVREPQYIEDIDHPEYEGKWGDNRKYIDDITLAHDITIARTGEQGVKMLEENTYDLLLLDHDMGAGMNGMGVIRWLQDNPTKIPKKIYLVTANIVCGPLMMEYLQRWKREGLVTKYDWIY